MTPAGRKERVDAVRNRETVLAAAARLLDAADDPGEVSMGDIAAAAGVGKGTLFRGFGDRIGLLQALADQRGDRLRTQLAAGESSSDPVERATATLDAILRFKLENRSLMLALENAGSGARTGARRTTGGTGTWRRSSPRFTARTTPTTWPTRCSPSCAAISSSISAISRRHESATASPISYASFSPATHRAGALPEPGPTATSAAASGVTIPARPERAGGSGGHLTGSRSVKGWGG